MDDENSTAFEEGWDTSTAPQEVSPETPEESPQSSEEAAETRPEEDSTPTEGTPEDGPQGAAETAEAAPEEGPAPAEAPEEAGRSAPAAPPAAEQRWSFSLGQEVRTVSAGEITPELLRKGYDYDRLQGAYAAAQPVMELFTALAQQAGMGVEDYTRFIRAEAKKAQGLNQEEARRAVEMEDRERAVSAKEAQERQAQEAREQSGQRVRADVAEFARAFPDAYARARTDPQAIPQSVWDQVQQGMSLTAAWARYSVGEAQRALSAAESRARTEQQNIENARRSTGSMASAGSERRSRDPFEEGWDGV